MGATDDPFGKAPGINDSANNMTAKVDERTSLLPDGGKVGNSAEGLEPGSGSASDQDGNIPYTKYGI